jgi:hypothetical protein
VDAAAMILDVGVQNDDVADDRKDQDLRGCADTSLKYDQEAYLSGKSIHQDVYNCSGNCIKWKKMINFAETSLRQHESNTACLIAQGYGEHGVDCHEIEPLEAGAFVAEECLWVNALVFLGSAYSRL